MKRAIDNGLLNTDLDANNLFIRNVRSLFPIPVDMVDTNDIRMTNPRAVLDGTVVNDSIALGAGIVQSKLSLTGTVPPSFTGIDGAARGDLVQPLTEKGAVNGYAS